LEKVDLQGMVRHAPLQLMESVTAASLNLEKNHILFLEEVMEDRIRQKDVAVI
jgi:hypothetical protein